MCTCCRGLATHLGLEVGVDFSRQRLKGATGSNSQREKEERAVSGQTLRGGKRCRTSQHQAGNENRW